MILLVLCGILLGSFALLTVAQRVQGIARLDAGTRGRISLALLFLFTGIGHFVNTGEMTAMLPAWVPARTAIVYATGLLEWAGAIGLLVPRFSHMAGLCLFMFLLAVFPANVYAAINRVGMGGHDAGPVYLLVRGPFQLLLVWWTYEFGIRRSPKKAALNAPGRGVRSTV